VPAGYGRSHTTFCALVAGTDALSGSCKEPHVTAHNNSHRIGESVSNVNQSDRQPELIIGTERRSKEGKCAVLALKADVTKIIIFGHWG